MRGIGYSFQLAITTPRINLIGYGTATAQSYRMRLNLVFAWQVFHMKKVTLPERGLAEIYFSKVKRVIDCHIDMDIILNWYIHG